MNKDTKTTEYVEKMKDIKLSESSRSRIESNLLEYARFHGVRVDSVGRSIKQVPKRTGLQGLRFTYMPIAILIAVFVGGGVTFAAQDALPGEMLYGVKTEVNENVRSAFAIGADAEARLQTSLLDERLEEAVALKTENKLEGETGVKMQSAMKKQVETAANTAAKAEIAAKASASERIVSTLNAYNALLESDTTLAINLEMLNLGADIKAAVATSLAAGPVDVAVLAKNTKARVASLQNVVADASADLSTKVSAELNTKISTALTLLADVSLQSETEARAQLEQVADLAGQVEATLSTLGTVKIDENNGAIIDIDFTNVPPSQLKIESDGSVKTDNQTDTSTTDTQTDAGIDTDIETDILDVEINSDTSVQSGLNL